MNQSTTAYVGLDVHKDSIDIALAETARDTDVPILGTVAGGVEPVTKALRRLISRGQRLHIAYEAGPCGFVLQRHLSALGWRCDVVAPSSIPRAPGERVKTDRRDAMKLARLARVGNSRPYACPTGVDEAMRDLVRGREDAVREQRNARHFRSTFRDWCAETLMAGQRAAAIMSLIQSAKLNGHDPYAYLKDVLTRLPTHRARHRRAATASLDPNLLSTNLPRTLRSRRQP